MEKVKKLNDLLCQFTIWLNWTLKGLGLLLIYHCIALKFALYTPFKGVELSVIEDKQFDMALAVMALQEDVVDLFKRVKK